MAFRIYHATQWIAGSAPSARANFILDASISSICKRTRGLPLRPVISINRQQRTSAKRFQQSAGTALKCCFLCSAPVATM